MSAATVWPGRRTKSGSSLIDCSLLVDTMYTHTTCCIVDLGQVKIRSDLSFRMTGHGGGLPDEDRHGDRSGVVPSGARALPDRRGHRHRAVRRHPRWAVRRLL